MRGGVPYNPPSTTPAVGDYERLRDQVVNGMTDSDYRKYAEAACKALELASRQSGAAGDRAVAMAAVYAQLAQAAAWREK